MEKMAFQTSSIRRTRDSSVRAFTLVEVMVGATISSFLMAGVLSTFLLMGRTGANIMNYTDIEAKARQALEMFSREAHNANDVTSSSTTSVTLKIPDKSSNPDGVLADGSALAGAYTVTYTFDTTNKKLTRSGPPIDNPTGTVSTTDLITGVLPVSGTDYLSYYRYVSSNTLGLGYVNGFTTNTAATPLEIKQIEVSFVLERKNVTVNAATNKVLSARFVLRNK